MAFILPYGISRGLHTNNRVRVPIMTKWMRDIDDMTSGMFDSPFRQMERLEHGLDRFMFHGDPILSTGGPYVTDENGQIMLKLEYDVRGYKPEEIHLKTKDNRLVLQGKHVEEGPGRRVHSEFTRVFDLPEGMDVTQLKSNLSRDGVLQIEGPAPMALEEPKETPIPIQQEQ